MIEDYAITEEQKEGLKEVSDQLYEYCKDLGLPLIVRVALGKTGPSEMSCSSYFEPEDRYSPKNREMKMVQEGEAMAIPTSPDFLREMLGDFEDADESLPN